MTFDATLSGATATSFITVPQFRAYCETRPNKSAALVALLADADNEPFEAPLVAATNDILYTTNWNPARVGSPVDPAQALPFPANDTMRIVGLESYYAISEQPDFLIKAASEQAIA